MKNKRVSLEKLAKRYGLTGKDMKQVTEQAEGFPAPVAEQEWNLADVTKWEAGVKNNYVERCGSRGVAPFPHKAL